MALRSGVLNRLALLLRLDHFTFVIALRYIHIFSTFVNPFLGFISAQGSKLNEKAEMIVS